MKAGSLTAIPMGGAGEIVEFHETYIGCKAVVRMRCGYQHRGEQHLHRYAAEFDVRYTKERVVGGPRTIVMITTFTP